MYNQTSQFDSEMPYLMPQYDFAPSQPMNPNRKMTRAEKKAIKRQTKAQKKLRKNGQLVGGPFLATVAPREEFFMGHQPINEIQKPGLATGLGIPEHGAHNIGSTGYGQTYGQGYGSNYGTTGSSYTSSYQSSQIRQGSPTVHYESAIPSSTCYTGSSLGSQYIGGSSYVSQIPTTHTQTVRVIEQPALIQQQQPLLQQQQQFAHPVQVQGYYDNMLLEQGHEKAGGFWAPFTGSLKNHGAGTTHGLQGQGKANFANTIATQLPGGHGQFGNGGYAQQNPLLNAPNLTYPVALEGERLKGLNNKHLGLNTPATVNGSGQKLSRKQKRAQKKALKQGYMNPEFNNAAVY